MNLTPETLDRLEAQARAQQGKEIGTGVCVTPWVLLSLLDAYRAQHAPADNAAGEVSP